MAESGLRLGSGLQALWSQPPGFLPQRPVTSGVHSWSYAAELRPACMDAASSVTTAEAERRVVLLCPEELGPPARTTPSHVAGLQVLLPGEEARPHRHTPAALRFHLEGEGAETDVDGEICPMHRHDLVLTPSTSWHGHRSRPGDGPVIWLDGVDLPIVRSVDAAFFGDLPGETAPDGPTVARLRYPWHEQVAALHDAADASAGPVTSLPYRDPHGGPVMPTTGAAAHVMEADSSWDRPRRTSSSVFVVVDGALTVVADERRLELAEHDIFVVQPWTALRFETGAERTHLFSFDDEPVLRSLGLYREEAGAVRQR